MQWTKQYRVFYKRGYSDQPKLVYAETETEARAMAIGEYRRNTGSNWSLLDFSTADEIVDHVEPIA